MLNIIDIENKLASFSKLQHEIGRDAAILKLSKQYSLAEVSFLADQLQGRAVAEDKFPSLAGRTDIIYPPSYYLEQTSSERTARFKAGLVSGQLLIDMTGGFGIDAWCFSEKIDDAFYIERDPVIFEIAAKNLQALNPAIETVCADSLEFLAKFDHVADWLYLDPIRRNQNRRLSGMQDFSPNLYEVRDLLFHKAHNIMVKLSPMTDISQAIRAMDERVNAVYVLSVDNDCKELLLLSDGQHHTHPPVTCINWQGNAGQQFVYSPPVPKHPAVSDPLTYLYEPNAAVFKAQAYDAAAVAFELNKLHPNTHLYTSAALHSDYPGKVYIVKDVLEFDAVKFRRSHAEPSYNIKTRNFPLSPAEVAKKLKIKEGGEQFVFCVRLKDGLRLIVCEKLTQ